MKTHLLAPVIALTILAGPVSAAPVEIDVPNPASAPASPLTRAEVLADLQIWRLSGLQDLERGELSLDTGSPRYQRAVATYQSLRSSPQFALLVQQLQENPRATVFARRTNASLAQSSN